MKTNISNDILVRLCAKAEAGHSRPLRRPARIDTPPDSRRRAVCAGAGSKISGSHPCIASAGSERSPDETSGPRHARPGGDIRVLLAVPHVAALMRATSCRFCSACEQHEAMAVVKGLINRGLSRLPSRSGRPMRRLPEGTCILSPYFRRHDPDLLASQCLPKSLSWLKKTREAAKCYWSDSLIVSTIIAGSSFTHGSSRLS
jgi:hypothetical protein